MPRPLTIEVFKDTETPCVDPSIALPAIHYINSLTDNSLQFIGGTKEVQVSRRPHMPTISPLDTSDFYGSSADIQLILTERDVLVDNREGAVGYSMKNLHHSGGIALVSTYRTSVETAPLTVAHEIGHLYGLSYGPEKNDPHCYDQSCLMYHEARHVDRKSVV